MPSLNKTMIIGHLGKDPEIRYLANGSAVCNFSVATTKKWKDKQSGESKEKTTWHNVVVWGKQGERAAEWLSKGQLVFVEGEYESEQWTDKDEKQRTSYKINAFRFDPLTRSEPKKSESKKREAAPADFDDDYPF